MAEFVYYDVTHVNGRYYYDILNRSLCRTRLKFELLDHFENVLYCIEQDIDSSNADSIVSNNEQGCRKSCSFTLINVDNKYTLDENHFFWFNRKFKIYLGVTDDTNTFWFSKGVYITKDANCNSVTHTVDISGVDKYAQLDGTLRTMQLDEMNTVFEQGSKVENAIRDILMLDMGNGFVLDPIEPIIDPEIADAKLYRTFTASAGEYFGAFMEEVMSCFGCNIFYDNNGRLTVRKIFNDDIPYWYAFKSPAHTFNYEISGYIAPSISMEMNGVNKIIAQNDTTEEQIYTYTAVNHNPRSPLCYDKIGARTLPENGGIVTIATGGADNDWYYDEWKHHVRYYAEYRLLKETCVAMSVKFNAPPYYHLNEDDVVYITDPDYNLDNDLFIINSITYPLSGGEIKIEAVNAKYLNTDISNDAITTEIRPVTYTIFYDIGDAIGYVPSTILTSSDTRFQAESGYSIEKSADNFYKTGYEFTHWYDAEDNVCVPLQYYPNPYDFLHLTSNFVDVSKRAVTIEMTGLSNQYITIPSMCPTTDYYNDYTCCIGVLAEFTVNNEINVEKKYIHGRGRYNYSSWSTSHLTGDLKYTVTAANVDFDFKSILDHMNNSDYLSLFKSVHFPDFFDSVNFISSSMAGVSTSNTCEKYIFPSEMETLTCQFEGTAYSYPIFVSNNYVKEIDFNNSKLLTITLNASGSSQSTSFIANDNSLEKVTFGNDVSFVCTTGSIKAFDTLNAYNPDIIINGSLSMQKTQFYSGGSSSATNENIIKINKVTMNDNSSSFVNSRSSSLTTVEVGEMVISSGSTFGGSTLKKIKIDKLVMTGSYIGGGATFADLIVGEISMTNGMFLSGTTVTNPIIINGDVNITGGSFMGGGIFVTAVEFHGSVNAGNCSFMCGNSNLADVYFYDDDVTFGNGSFFQGNNANFTIHGVADGNVEAYCQSHNITFEVITD